ncbi:hypothetical protein JCM19314_3271 [Nonlabens ulvanivorans]|uniref:Uncharacterized protein n=1 Tax=Nonlabens ulvanivorans TaxID=906888 RepID=A0A090Q8A3_NONUL|nr:hypothetical protein JCM19314_3271 [Nonlabens ulvanivorans]
MNELWEDRNNENRVPHPVFGDFTKDQWGHHAMETLKPSL